MHRCARKSTSRSQEKTLPTKLMILFSEKKQNKNKAKQKTKTKTKATTTTTTTTTKTTTTTTTTTTTKTKTKTKQKKSVHSMGRQSIWRASVKNLKRSHPMGNKTSNYHLDENT